MVRTLVIHSIYHSVLYIQMFNNYWVTASHPNWLRWQRNIHQLLNAAEVVERGWKTWLRSYSNYFLALSLRPWRAHFIEFTLKWKEYTGWCLNPLLVPNLMWYTTFLLSLSFPSFLSLSIHWIFIKYYVHKIQFNCDLTLLMGIYLFFILHYFKVYFFLKEGGGIHWRSQLLLFHEQRLQKWAVFEYVNCLRKSAIPYYFFS